MTQHDNEYLTFDLWLCAYLEAIGVKLLRTETETGLCGHIYDDSDGVASREGKRWAEGNPQAPARNVLLAWKQVWARVARSKKER